MKHWVVVAVAVLVMGQSATADTGGEPANTNATSVLGAAVRYNGGSPPPRASVRRAAAPSGVNRVVFLGVVIMVLVCAVKIVLRHRLSGRHAVSLDVVMIAIGFALLLIMRLPVGGHPGWESALLFVGLAALYKLLGYFEEPAEKK